MDIVLVHTFVEVTNCVHVLTAEIIFVYQLHYTLSFYDMERIFNYKIVKIFAPHDFKDSEWWGNDFIALTIGSFLFCVWIYLRVLYFYFFPYYAKYVTLKNGEFLKISILCLLTRQLIRFMTIAQKEKELRKNILSETVWSCNVEAVNIYACKEVIILVCCTHGVIVLFKY
jgi:hypothetical protein